MQYTQTPNTRAALLDLALDSVAHRGETSRAQFGSLTVEVAVKPVWGANSFPWRLACHAAYLRIVARACGWG